MTEIEDIGRDWIIEQAESLTEEVTHVRPSEYNERVRYLPASVTSIPGFLRYDVNPFAREIVDCFDIDSPVREVNVKKGVQITYTTMLESGILYFASHIRTLPMMYMTADKELAEARIENNFIPMFNQSDIGDIIRSSDEGNTRKTGKTKNHIQFAGGAYLIPFGAKNADKMRSFSICVFIKDEIDAWPQFVGKDGDPDAISDDRCSAYWERRKIFRGSTPLILGVSKIEKVYKRGDQRKYHVRCKKCGFSQVLVWRTKDRVGGFKFDINDGVLDIESVRYCCANCGEPHMEHDKERLFSEKHGAEWVPTAKPVEPGIRSYHLPAFYSPIGMQPWYKCVSQFLEGYDPVSNKVIDIGKYQVFINNITAEPFEVLGSKVKFVQVSAHRRIEYRFGQVPNKHAMKRTGSHVLFLTCQVDVHKSNLAVSVMGWCKGSICYLIDYWRIEDDDCTQINSRAWRRLRDIIEDKQYVADDNKKYRITLTLVDAAFSNDTVTTFCSDYSAGVYPILGRNRPAKNQKISEFAEFKTQAGTVGYRILVDHYKDRMAPALRREWVPEEGQQKAYHFNAPVDATDAQLKELTVETRREQTDANGVTSYVWYRPGNARNELWDLLGYGHAAVEILAWQICINHFELKTIDWAEFWRYIEVEKLYYTG